MRIHRFSPLKWRALCPVCVCVCVTHWPLTLSLMCCLMVLISVSLSTWQNRDTLNTDLVFNVLLDGAYFCVADDVIEEGGEGLDGQDFLLVPEVGPSHGRLVATHVTGPDLGLHTEHTVPPAACRFVHSTPHTPPTSAYSTNLSLQYQQYSTNISLQN